MEKDIDQLFENLKESFDIEEPQTGHEERFLNRLETAQGVVNIHRKKRSLIRPLSIAASIAVLIAVGIGLYTSSPSIEEQVANISPEVANTEFYFANLVAEQVKQLQDESTPETQQIIDDTMRQLLRLEIDYKSLEENLLNGGNSKMLLSAMITNFQTRIDLLQEVLNKIEMIKNLKKQNDANYTI